MMVDGFRPSHVTIPGKLSKPGYSHNLPSLVHQQSFLIYHPATVRATAASNSLEVLSGPSKHGLYMMTMGVADRIMSNVQWLRRNPR